MGRRLVMEANETVAREVIAEHRKHQAEARGLVERLRSKNPDGRPVGLCSFEVARAGKVLERVSNGNLVVDAGLDWLREFAFDAVTPTTIARMGWIAIGTSNAAPATTDVLLGAEIDRDAFDTYTPGGTGVVTVQRTFPASIGWEPATIVEAGIFNVVTPSTPTMWNRVVLGGVSKTTPDTLKVVFTIAFS